MVKSRNILISGLFVALFGCLFSCSNGNDKQITSLENRIKSLEEKLAEGDEEEVEIAPYMARLQRYAANLYYAGKAENKELAEFYIHEMEEIMEELVEYGIYEDGIDISAQIKMFGLSSLGAFENNYFENNFKYFDDRYTSLISSCNACHEASGKSVIKLEAPALPAPKGQVFTKP